MITEQSEILLVYSDPDITKSNEVSVTQVSIETGTSQIKVQIIALSNEYVSFFRGQEPALFVDETIFLSKPLIYVNDYNEILSVKREKRLKEDIDCTQWNCEIKASS